MKKGLKIIFGLMLLNLVTIWGSFAQCAMCRASVSSTISDGRNDVGNGINGGILYMLAFPYLLVAVGGYLWYRKAKENQFKQEQLQAQMRRLIDRDR
jgi:hypothetical protein